MEVLGRRQIKSVCEDWGEGALAGQRIVGVGVLLHICSHSCTFPKKTLVAVFLSRLLVSDVLRMEVEFASSFLITQVALNHHPRVTSIAICQPTL